MNARLLRYKKDIYPDGSISETVIWQLPEPTIQRPHGYKYRLNYSLPDGTTLDRYDNELGKGDHRIKNKEFDYEFSTPEQAVLDFLEDMKANGGYV